MKALIARCLALTALLVLTAVVDAQDRPAFGFGGMDTKHASAKLYLREQQGDVRAAIAIEIDPEWHLYHDVLGPEDAIGRPTRVTFSGADIAWSAVRFPEPKRLPQEVGLNDRP